jgi:hypothetical protein
LVSDTISAESFGADVSDWALALATSIAQRIRTPNEIKKTLFILAPGHERRALPRMIHYSFRVLNREA